MIVRPATRKEPRSKHRSVTDLVQSARRSQSTLCCASGDQDRGACDPFFECSWVSRSASGAPMVKDVSHIGIPVLTSPLLLDPPSVSHMGVRATPIHVTPAGLAFR